MRRSYNFAAPRRRRSPVPAILLVLVLLVVGGLVYLGSVDTEVPLREIEQDVTNEALAD